MDWARPVVQFATCGVRRLTIQHHLELTRQNLPSPIERCVMSLAELPAHQDAVRSISEDVKELYEGSIPCLDRTRWLEASCGSRRKLLRHSTRIPRADLYLSGCLILTNPGTPNTNTCCNAGESNPEENGAVTAAVLCSTPITIRDRGRGLRLDFHAERVARFNRLNITAVQGNLNRSNVAGQQQLVGAHPGYLRYGCPRAHWTNGRTIGQHLKGLAFGRRRDYGPTKQAG